MSPVERLQAAIERLETLRTTAPWQRELLGIGATTSRGLTSYVVKDDGLHPSDADLIVTLHRTIDAQLGILRRVLVAAYVEYDWDTNVFTEAALVLADAILGDPA